MQFNAKTTGIALAIAAASLAGCESTMKSSDAMASKSGSAKVHCYGINSCKGHNDCKTATNACKGMASCKGQGFLSMTKMDCDKKGGTVGA